MRPIASIPALTLLLVAPSAASASEVTDSGALALAAIVAQLSPDIGDADKQALAKLLDGDTGFQWKTSETIAVTAKSIKCHTSNVDLTSHDCTLTFGGKDSTLTGRAAHELLATLAEEGLQPDAGAGNVWYALSALDCAIDVAQVKAKDGGGVSCTFGPAD
ncbi:hypothetical protein A7A08_02944 [Methyloligella halotolerans]|uniref:Uncharacterized protein n=1 Tax=Methyloligella halotolerans TaxID=1177755 RepID=A0A1E2RVB6_9HYPH|nr:hypothetical protein [Methyloligella halotolerans]ODA66092.1 hypothetical protein A7A08_02944 [Methyloligella halotolerans]